VLDLLSIPEQDDDMQNFINNLKEMTENKKK